MEGVVLKVDVELRRLEVEIADLYDRIQRMTNSPPKTLTAQVSRLFELRSEVYEDLNQLQHKSLILTAAKQLEGVHRVARWTWHPKQTSAITEADLTGYNLQGRPIVNAEVTTSRRPIGTIDKRMFTTLNSLAMKEGALYYFVQTDSMLKRAQGKVEKNGWNQITCRKII